MKLGDKIYYTGDMANADGIFTVTAVRGNPAVLEMTGEDGKMIKGIYAAHVGHVYNGNCAVRFVTLEARNAYRNAAIDEMRRASERRAYLARVQA